MSLTAKLKQAEDLIREVFHRERRSDAGEALSNALFYTEQALDRLYVLERRGKL